MQLDSDWKINLEALEKRRLSLMVIKDGRELFRSPKSGMLPLIDLLETERDRLVGTTVVDRVVGGAAAKLLLWQHVKRIDALVASRRAKDLLRHSGVEFNYRELVPRLIDPKTGQPNRFETMCVKYDYPQLFYGALREELLIFKAS
ncbi:MAG: DUF1893 domain-containing protein [candidate division WOR-3 bacterium]